MDDLRLNIIHSFPYSDIVPQFRHDHSDFPYFRLVHGNDTLGYITTPVMRSFGNLLSSYHELSSPFYIDEENATVTIRGITFEERTENVEKVVQTWKAKRTFQVLAGWRDEPYPVYGSTGTLLFEIERSAAPLLGIVTYGVHMTVFTKTDEGLKLWIPRRSRHKQTYGGMYDNSVAGGISSTEGPMESLIREAAEEASLPEDLVRSRAISCGSVSYFHIRDARAGGEVGLLQPEYEYVYDMELFKEDIPPRPNDDEVEKFYLMDIQEVQRAMKDGEFKPNCALVLLDFFIRHGILTPENEVDYVEILARIHRKLNFPLARGSPKRTNS